MLSNASVHPTIPTVNLDRARDFYENVLGLEVYREMDENGVMYRCGDTVLALFPRATASSGQHTVASFQVGDQFDAIVDGLLERGVTFDTFDMPGIEWDDRGIATMGAMQGGWFKDPDGNILAVVKDM